MDSFIKEIEEDLQQEKLVKAWKQYGNYLIAGLFTIILGTAGTIYWNQYQLDKSHSQSDAYAQALGLAEEGKTAEALERFAKISQENHVYASLAALQQAGLMLEQGDPASKAAAADILKKLSENSQSDNSFRQLATILYTLSQLDKEDPKRLLDKLRTTGIGANSWEILVNELTAILTFKTGDQGKARAILQELEKTKWAPDTIKLRAKILQSHLLETKQILQKVP